MNDDAQSNHSRWQTLGPTYPHHVHVAYKQQHVILPLTSIILPINSAGMWPDIQWNISQSSNISRPLHLWILIQQLISGSSFTLSTSRQLMSELTHSPRQEVYQLISPRLNLTNYFRHMMYAYPKFCGYESQKLWHLFQPTVFVSPSFWNIAIYHKYENMKQTR